jgi:hypothetical protein
MNSGHKINDQNIKRKHLIFTAKAIHWHRAVVTHKTNNQTNIIDQQHNSPRRRTLSAILPSFFLPPFDFIVLFSFVQKSIFMNNVICRLGGRGRAEV